MATFIMIDSVGRLHPAPSVVKEKANVGIVRKSKINVGMI
jgi:hypothetical protein